jgi:tetratricopeptide (TPR) repeat protein
LFHSSPKLIHHDQTQKEIHQESAQNKTSGHADAGLSYIQNIFAGFGNGAPSDEPLDRAQALIYQAWEIPNPAKRIALAKQALSICDDCADAYMLLAEEQPHTLEQALDLYEQATAAGERALSVDTRENGVGHYWGLHETRPYMRARLQLALTLWEFGDRSMAIEHAQDMLRLNPMDNQGARYILLGWWLAIGNLSEARALWKAYKDDAMACWMWSQALMTYIEHGPGSQANVDLEAAIEANPHVGPLLLRREALPMEPPEYVGLGDPAEAVAYVMDYLEVWQQSDGALRWLSKAIPAKARR